MSADFKIVESTRRTSHIEPVLHNEQIVNALADNLGNIIKLTRDIVDIQRMKVQSEAVLAKMEADRKMLLAEAESYAIKKNADTKNVIDRMKLIQELLRDFYTYNQGSTTGITSEDFTRIISVILSEMD